ncbi:MAG: CHAD domain-containing protein [Thermoleophilaceae bacterium]
MKARKVGGLDPDGSFGEAAARIAQVRLAELWSFADEALDPANGRAQHDMRIAAKRVRYLLELSEPCFGALARDGAKAARELQDLLGEIHDCDVFVERIQHHLHEIRAGDVAAAVAGAPRHADDLDPRELDGDGAAKYRGLERAVVYFEARRRVIHRRFAERWWALERRSFRERLEEGLTATTT